MSSVILVDGRDVKRDQALLKETKRKVREALALRNAALVEKYRSKKTNTVVDLYPGSGPWELHSHSGALTFVRGVTEILAATESPAESNKWVLTYEAPEARFLESSPVLLRNDRAIPEPNNNICPD